MKYTLFYNDIGFKVKRTFTIRFRYLLMNAVTNEFYPLMSHNNTYRRIIQKKIKKSLAKYLQRVYYTNRYLTGV